MGRRVDGMAGRLTLQAAGKAWLARSPSPAARAAVCWRRSWSPESASRWRSRRHRTRARWIDPESAGKAAGVNTMMCELGGVFGIAVAIAVFAGVGSFASAQSGHRRVQCCHRRRRGPRAGWGCVGCGVTAVSGLALPGRRTPSTASEPVEAVELVAVAKAGDPR